MEPCLRDAPKLQRRPVPLTTPPAEPPSSCLPDRGAVAIIEDRAEARRHKHEHPAASVLGARRALSESNDSSSARPASVRTTSSAACSRSARATSLARTTVVRKVRCPSRPEGSSTAEVRARCGVFRKR